MAKSITSYSVFIASPGGLAEERQAFRDVIEEFNQSAAKPDGISFEPVGWEETLGGVGRPQSLINEELRKCDFFILMLWDRWGMAPGGTSNYTSGTEEEYYEAMQCHAAGSMQQILILFKSIDPKQLNDPGAQLSRVLEFQKQIEKERLHLYERFDSIDRFKGRLRAHLDRWLRQMRGKAENSILDNDTLAAPALNNVQSELSTDIFNSSKLDTDAGLDVNEKIELAWQLANDGKFIEAEMGFAQAAINSQNPSVLLQYGQFLSLFGLLDRATGIFKEVIKSAKRQDLKLILAHAYNNLGNILRIQGDTAEAEKYYRDSLPIYEKLNNLIGMANVRSNIGNILRINGKLSEAEAMFRESIEIEEQAEEKSGIAVTYCNLANVLLRRGDLDEAESMLNKALLLVDSSVLPDNTAANIYGSVGIIKQKRGELNDAETMLRKALELSEKLGNAEVVAVTYGNLGNIFKAQGKLSEAEDMYRKCIDISELSDISQGLASGYGSLAGLKYEQGDLDEAERLLHRAIEIDVRSGRLRGLMGGYKNLSEVMHANGKEEESISIHNKYLEIFNMLNK